MNCQESWRIDDLWVNLVKVYRSKHGQIGVMRCLTITKQTTARHGQTATKWIFVPKGLDEHIFKYHATEISWTALKHLKMFPESKVCNRRGCSIGEHTTFLALAFHHRLRMQQGVLASKLRLTQKRWFQQLIVVKFWNFPIAVEQGIKCSEV